jgi:hypothetical protein
MKKVNDLKKYSKNVNSQFGEDGILEKVFQIIPDSDKWCVEFGAWDGKFLSNCYHLISSHNWSSVMIEANTDRFKELKDNHGANSNVFLINKFVEFEGDNTLDLILQETPIPQSFDLLSIDIDGNDYHIWDSLNVYSPKVVIIEFNPSIPSDIEFVQKRDFQLNQGSSLNSICQLAKSKGYELIATTDCNAIFVKQQYFDLFGIKDNSHFTIWDTEVDAPRVFHLYDGTIVLTKEFSLSWSDVNVGIYDLQKVPDNLRFYKDSQTKSKSGFKLLKSKVKSLLR